MSEPQVRGWNENKGESVLERARMHYRQTSTAIMKLPNWSQILILLCIISISISNGESICGNGILEEQEECDCGKESECKDPCCRALVCTLKEGAECSNLEPCCRSCKFKRKWEVCRNAENECDLPEYCTGKMGACPPNQFQKDGKNCSHNQGYCSKGYCLTHETQCKIIFNNRPVSTASEGCYEELNRMGNERGHCGNLSACPPENVMCGALQCVDAHHASNSQSKLFSSNRDDPEPLSCPTIGSTTPLVQDRTKCDDGKVCMNQRCVNMSQVLDVRGRCPSNDSSVECSGHGDCTNRFTCLCKIGWGSEDCSKVEELEPIRNVATTRPTPRYHEDIPVTRSQPQGIILVTLKDGGGKEDTNYTLGMIFAIAVVTISILFFMCALVYCYLFSSPISKAKESLDSQADEYGMDENALRPPQQPSTNHISSGESQKIMDLIPEKADEVTIHSEENNSRKPNGSVNNKESSVASDSCENQNMVNDSKQLSKTEAEKNIENAIPAANAQSSNPPAQQPPPQSLIPGDSQDTS